MTGRELIIYILKHGLEDETVGAWTKLDTMALDSIKVVEGIYISENIFKEEPKTDEWNNKIGGRRT